MNIILILHKCTSCRQSIYPSNHIKDSWQGLHKVLENIFNQTVAQLLEAQTHLRNSISLVCSTFLRTKLILINTEWTTNPNKTIPQQVTYNEWHSYLPFSPNLLFQEVHTHVQETWTIHSKFFFFYTALLYPLYLFLSLHLSVFFHLNF